MLMLTFDVLRTATSKPAKLLQWSMHSSSTFVKADHWVSFCSTAIDRAAFKQWKMLC